MIIFETVWHLWKFTLKFSAPCVSDLFPRRLSPVGRKKRRKSIKRGLHLLSSVLHTGLICAWFQTNTGSYRALTQGLHSPNRELFIRRKSYKCLPVCSCLPDSLPWGTGRIPLSSLEWLTEQYQVIEFFRSEKVMGEGAPSDTCSVASYKKPVCLHGPLQEAKCWSAIVIS